MSASPRTLHPDTISDFARAVTADQNPQPPWRDAKALSAPLDRAIWLRANIVRRDEARSYVSPYEGFARWEADAWVDQFGRPIKLLPGETFFHQPEADIFPIEWMECKERAEGAPSREMDFDCRIFFFDRSSDWNPEGWGFYAVYDRVHYLTGWEFRRESLGPYATMEEAFSALGRVIYADSEVAI